MKNKIIITLEGGLIQSIQTTVPMEYMIVDVDDNDIDLDEDLLDLYPGEGKVWAAVHPAKLDPELVETVFERYRNLKGIKPND
jgi:hypothetical protein